MSANWAPLPESVGHRPLLVPAAVACTRDEHRRVLLLRRSDGEDLWGFPGGAMELGECAGDAVGREAYEGIGLQIEPP